MNLAFGKYVSPPEWSRCECDRMTYFTSEGLEPTPWICLSSVSALLHLIGRALATSPQYPTASSMTFGLHPVSNRTRPLGCSMRKEGQGKSSKVSPPPCINSDAGAVNCAPGRAHIFFALPSAMLLPRADAV